MIHKNVFPVQYEIKRSRKSRKTLLRELARKAREVQELPEKRVNRGRKPEVVR